MGEEKRKLGKTVGDLEDHNYFRMQSFESNSTNSIRSSSSSHLLPSDTLVVMSTNPVRLDMSYNTKSQEISEIRKSPLHRNKCSLEKKSPSQNAVSNQSKNESCINVVSEEINPQMQPNFNGKSSTMAKLFTEENKLKNNEITTAEMLTTVRGLHSETSSSFVREKDSLISKNLFNFNSKSELQKLNAVNWNMNSLHDISFGSKCELSVSPTDRMKLPNQTKFDKYHQICSDNIKCNDGNFQNKEAFQYAKSRKNIHVFMQNVDTEEKKTIDKNYMPTNNIENANVNNVPTESNLIISDNDIHGTENMSFDFYNLASVIADDAKKNKQYETQYEVLFRSQNSNSPSNNNGKTNENKVDAESYTKNSSKSHSKVKQNTTEFISSDNSNSTATGNMFSPNTNVVNDKTKTAFAHKLENHSFAESSNKPVDNEKLNFVEFTKSSVSNDAVVSKLSSHDDDDNLCELKNCSENNVEVSFEQNTATSSDVSVADIDNVGSSKPIMEEAKIRIEVNNANENDEVKLMKENEANICEPSTSRKVSEAVSNVACKPKNVFSFAFKDFKTFTTSETIINNVDFNESAIKPNSVQPNDIGKINKDKLSLPLKADKIESSASHKATSLTCNPLDKSKNVFNFVATVIPKIDRTEPNLSVCQSFTDSNAFSTNVAFNTPVAQLQHSTENIIFSHNVEKTMSSDTNKITHYNSGNNTTDQCENEANFKLKSKNIKKHSNKRKLDSASTSCSSLNCKAAKKNKHKNSLKKFSSVQNKKINGASKLMSSEKSTDIVHAPSSNPCIDNYEMDDFIKAENSFEYSNVLKQQSFNNSSSCHVKDKCFTNSANHMKSTVSEPFIVGAHVADFIIKTSLTEDKNPNVDTSVTNTENASIEASMNDCDNLLPVNENSIESTDNDNSQYLAANQKMKQPYKGYRELSALYRLQAGYRKCKSNEFWSTENINQFYAGERRLPVRSCRLSQSVSVQEPVSV